MTATTTCPACEFALDPGFTATCPQCSQSLNSPWQRWLGLIRVIGAVGFMLVLRFPWQATTCVGALVAAYALLTRNSAEIPLDREGVAKQERNPAHPQLLRAATFCVPLSGALFLVSCMITFVTFMNAREQWQRESAGNDHTSSFRVLQSYWQKRGPGRLGAGGSHETRAFARGMMEGNEEWMDLVPYLGFIPKDEETVLRVVPPGTVLPIYYDPRPQGDYRVRIDSAAAAGVASRNAAAVVAKYGAVALPATGLLLLGFLRLPRYSLASALRFGELRLLLPPAFIDLPTHAT